MIWKHFLLCGTLFVSALTFLPTSANACGWDPEWENEFYRFMAPEMARQEMFEPFQFTWDNLYSYNLMSPDMSHNANARDWAEYFGEGITESDVLKVVYGMGPDDLSMVQKKASGDKNLLLGDISSNRLIRQWSKGEWRESLDYLQYALRVEPFCVADVYDWGEDDRTDAPTPNRLVEEGIRAYKASNDDFIKIRYAYQVVRLLRYDSNAPEAVKMFEELAAPLAHVNNTVYWWTVSHYAGALRYSKKPIESAYEFSRVFDNCPTRRIAAYRGFRVKSDEQWNEVMNLCKSGHEKATLHFIRAITPNALAMEELRDIQRLSPGSEMADVLLQREINKIEGELLGYPFSSKQAYYKGMKTPEHATASKNLRSLQVAVDETIDGKAMHDADLWKLSKVYLIFLAGDAAGASKALSKTRPKLSEAGALRGSLLDLVLRIAMTKKVDASVENTLLKDLTNLSGKLSKEKAEELRKFMDEALAWLYEAQGQSGKALLARRRQYAIDDAKLPAINDLLKFEAKPNPTLYEKQLLERMHASVNHNQLLEVKGTRLLGKNLLEEAIKVFNAIPENVRSSSSTFSLDADPFKGRIRDIVNCWNYDCGGGDNYTKLSLAEAMLTLQKKAIQEPENAGKYYHLLGNAYYNITFFGPAWGALDYHRSGGNWGYLGYYESWYQFDPETFDEVVDMSLAEKYYTKSVEASNDPELAALSTYMAAKCELNRFYMSGEETKDGYQTHFSDLVGNYRNTQIYDQLVRECFYFRQYQN
jgi:hypothetical protein